MQMLAEGKGIAAPADSKMEYLGKVHAGNGATALSAIQPLLQNDHEAWVFDVVTLGQSWPTPNLVDDTEAEAILSTPDVADAIDQVLPDIEAWEREH